MLMISVQGLTGGRVETLKTPIEARQDFTFLWLTSRSCVVGGHLFYERQSLVSAASIAIT